MMTMVQNTGQSLDQDQTTYSSEMVSGQVVQTIQTVQSIIGVYSNKLKNGSMYPTLRSPEKTTTYSQQPFY